MAARTSPAVPAFSYAQAAKGISPAMPATQAPAEQNKNGQRAGDRKTSGDPTSLDLSTTSKEAGKPEESKSQSNRNASRDHSQSQGRGRTNSAWDSVAHERTQSIAQSAVNEKGDASSTQFQTSGTASSVTPAKEDDIALPNGTSDSTWDVQSQASGEKSQQSKEEGKVKENDDDWEKVSVPSVAAEKELKAAPIPVVNIWQQRKEAQDAKLKSLAVQKPAGPAVKSKDVQQGGSSVGGKTTTKPRGLGITDESDTKDRKKSSDTGKPGLDTRKALKQNRATQEKDVSETRALPPVGDATMWPTPENAVVDEKKLSPVEKLEKAEDVDSKNPMTKPHAKEKWLKVEHVPTVKWEFYQPPTTSRRGGRPGRGNRGGGENGGRGGHLSGTSQAERNDKSSAMGPPPVPRPQRQEDRGRTESISASVRSSSLPTQASRNAETTMESTNANENTNNEVALSQSMMSTSKIDSTASQEASTANPAETTLPARPRGDSKASSRGPYPNGYKGNNFDPTRTANYHGESHAHPRAQGIERRSIPPNFYTQGDIFEKEQGDDRREHVPRRNDFGRENNPSWRDRETHSERPDRREPRSERGRGGYRGRGNHNNFAAQNAQNQSWSTPLPQHPFPSKSQSFTERHRQSSAPYMGNMQQNPRSNVRSQSIPTSGYQQPMSPTQQDLQGMFYPMSQSMTAQMPYSMDYNLMATMKLVQAQIEYYFSIENLCKDLFLRRHMDSQGFVLFSFIAGFKRLQQLTEDSNVIRETCAQIPTIEYVHGEDGAERLRRREGWGQWIMPMDERDPSAQNAGPTSVRLAGANYHGYPQMFGQGYPMSPNHDMGNPVWMNGGVPQQMYPQAFGYGRNDNEFQQMNQSMMGYSGNLDRTATPELHDDKRGFYMPAYPEPKTNGTRSPNSTIPKPQEGGSETATKVNEPAGKGDEPPSSEQVDQPALVVPNGSHSSDVKVHEGISSQADPVPGVSTDSVPSAALHGGAASLEQ